MTMLGEVASWVGVILLLCVAALACIGTWIMVRSGWLFALTLQDKYEAEKKEREKYPRR